MSSGLLASLAPVTMQLTRIAVVFRADDLKPMGVRKKGCTPAPVAWLLLMVVLASTTEEQFCRCVTSTSSVASQMLLFTDSLVASRMLYLFS